MKTNGLTKTISNTWETNLWSQRQGREKRTMTQTDRRGKDFLGIIHSTVVGTLEGNWNVKKH